MLYAWLLDWLYPRRCVGCGLFYPEPFCRLCEALTERIVLPACRRCGAPLSGGDCRACEGRSYCFDEAICAGIYTGPVRHAIVNLKYRRWFRAVEPLSQLVRRAVEMPERAYLKGADGLIPLPVHRRRLAERGFNQIQEVARQVAQALGVPLLPEVVQRRFYRRPQVGLSAHARWQNVQGAFEVVQPEAVQGRFLILMDDVLTTGSTLDGCARALKDAGAAYVVALTIARDMRLHDSYSAP